MSHNGNHNITPTPTNIPQRHIHIIADKSALNTGSNDLARQHESSQTGCTNQPELRHYLIKQQLINELCDQNKYATLSETDELADIDIVCKLHNAQYIEFLRDAHSDGKSQRDKDWYYPGTDSLLPYNIHVGVVHQSLINKQPIYKRAGLYAKDNMTPILSHTYVQVMRSANAAIQSAQYLLHNKSSIVYALCTSPGHHCDGLRYSGYCFINNAALSADILSQNNTYRVGVLDIDYHAGDGTQSMFYHRNDIITCSIHADPTYDYPSYSGYSDEVGTGQGINCHLNLPLPPKANYNTHYKSAVNKALQFLKQHSIQYLVLAFGADSYKDDPDPSNLAGMLLDLNDYYSIGALIRNEIPDIGIVITQEGGYNLDAVPTIVSNLLKGLSGIHYTVDNQ